MSKQNGLEEFETANKEFLDHLEKKLKDMGVAEAYSDSDLKDAMYLLVKDTLTEIRTQMDDVRKNYAKSDINDGVIVGLRVSQDCIKKHLGVSQNEKQDA